MIRYDKIEFDQKMGDISDPWGVDRFLSWVLHTKMHGANTEACKKNRSSRLGLKFWPTYLSNVWNSLACSQHFVRYITKHSSWSDIVSPMIDWWSTESLLPSETGWETLEAKSASIHDEKTLVTDSSKLRCYQMPIVHLLVLSLSWNTKKNTWHWLRTRPPPRELSRVFFLLLAMGIHYE